MTAPYRVAILATGRIAHAHARGYQMAGGCALEAAADINPETLNGFCEKFGVARRYADYPELLANEKPDLVSVCSFPGLHAPMVLEAAKHRPKAILCEKPMTLTLADADAMIAACREAGTLLVIGHQRRFSPQYVAARRVIDAGTLGPIRLIEAYGHPGCTLFVDTTHTVDLIRFFLADDPVEWVLGQVDDSSRREAWGHPIEDAMVAWIGFRGGARALVTAGGMPMFGMDMAHNLFPPGDWDGRNYHQFVLHGRDARLEIDGDAPVGDRPMVRIHRGAEVEPVPLPWNPAGWRDWQPGQPPPDPLPSFAQEIRTMMDCVEHGGEHPLRAEQGRAATEILLAICESARRRALVRMPLEIADNPLFAMRG